MDDYRAATVAVFASAWAWLDSTGATWYGVEIPRWVGVVLLALSFALVYGGAKRLLQAATARSQRRARNMDEARAAWKKHGTLVDDTLNLTRKQKAQLFDEITAKKWSEWNETSDWTKVMTVRALPADEDVHVGLIIYDRAAREIEAEFEALSIYMGKNDGKLSIDADLTIDVRSEKEGVDFKRVFGGDRGLFYGFFGEAGDAVDAFEPVGINGEGKVVPADAGDAVGILKCDGGQHGPGQVQDMLNRWDTAKLISPWLENQRFVRDPDPDLFARDAVELVRRLADSQTVMSDANGRPLRVGQRVRYTDEYYGGREHRMPDEEYTVHSMGVGLDRDFVGLRYDNWMRGMNPIKALPETLEIIDDDPIRVGDIVECGQNGVREGDRWLVVDIEDDLAYMAHTHEATGTTAPMDVLHRIDRLDEPLPEWAMMYAPKKRSLYKQTEAEDTNGRPIVNGDICENTRRPGSRVTVFNDEPDHCGQIHVIDQELPGGEGYHIEPYKLEIIDRPKYTEAKGAPMQEDPFLRYVKPDAVKIAEGAKHETVGRGAWVDGPAPEYEEVEVIIKRTYRQPRNTKH